MSNTPQLPVCTTSLKSDGNMDFRFGDQETVIANRKTFLRKNGILYEDHIAMRCDHGDTINLVTSFNPEVGATSQEEQIQSEVLITQEKGLALMLFTADCQPTSFYDPVTETIALAHISRKTLCNKLSKKVVHFLHETFGVAPENLMVHIGPSIQKQSYVFPLPLDEVNEELALFIETKENNAYIDLIRAHQQQLHALGIAQEHISVSDEDTYSEAFFSYYRTEQKGLPDEGRMATLLMLKAA